MAFEKGGPASRGLTRLAFAYGANAACGTGNAFIADKAYEVIGVQEVHNVLGTDAGAVTIDVKKCTGTTAAGSGTGSTVLASTFNAKATINTNVIKTLGNGGLSATAADRFLAKGDRLAIVFAGTLTALAGVVVEITLRPVGAKATIY